MPSSPPYSIFVVSSASFLGFERGLLKAAMGDLPHPCPYAGILAFFAPEHCLVNGGVPLFWWKKPCSKWLQNVSFKEPCSQAALFRSPFKDKGPLSHSYVSSCKSLGTTGASFWKKFSGVSPQYKESRIFAPLGLHPCTASAIPCPSTSVARGTREISASRRRF